MRKPPPIKPPQVKKRPTSTITQERRYQLITPLFGGGVEAAEMDEITPIRGSAIRGHLRFWWRACRGGQFNGNLAQMKEAEGQLWGAASTEDTPYPSQVQIEVETTHKGEPFPEDMGSFRSEYSYVGFPLRDAEGASVQKDIKFKLRICFPHDAKEEIEAALWAWQTFGGLGARTRRGFGALRCTNVSGTKINPYSTQNVAEDIRQGLQTHVTPGTWPADVPHLTPDATFKITRANRDVLAAWRYLIKRLKEFRQLRGRGQGNRPGRSKWPEPDAIRRLTHRHASRHANELSQIDKFPRAAFGLPIIFHFKDKRAGDPGDTSLEGSAGERLASPLILRSLSCKKGKAVGIALLLEGRRTEEPLIPGGITLKGARRDPQVNPFLTQAEAKTIPHLAGQPDILQAFLDQL